MQSIQSFRDVLRSLVRILFILLIHDQIPQRETKNLLYLYLWLKW